MQLAVNNVLAPPMEIHVDARSQFPTEREWEQYLERSAETMIQLYGDAENPFPAINPEEEETDALMTMR